MKHNAVLDRFEENKAVLLIGENEIAVTFDRDLLPPEADEGDILSIAISVDPEATRAAREEAETLMRRLLEQNQGK